MKKKCIAGNWKMNHGPAQTREYFGDFLESYRPGRADVLFFVPSVSLIAAVESTWETDLQIGAQNAHAEKSGAFTGEISAPLLQEIHVHHVLIGHSERRQLFGETDASINTRTRGLLAQDMKVMVCVGETRTERESGQTQAVLIRQIREGLKGILPAQLDHLRIAYEPVWAIGTGLVASVEQAVEAHQIIRQEITRLYSDEGAQKLAILYGGSVTPENAEALLSQAEIDGALVGGASLKPDSFLKILDFCG